MGSEVSSSQKSSLATGLLVPYHNMAEICVKYRKPPRSILAAEDFYCPLINSDENWNMHVKRREPFASEAEISSLGDFEKSEEQPSARNDFMHETEDVGKMEVVEDSNKTCMLRSDNCTGQEFHDEPNEAITLTNNAGVTITPLLLIDPSPTESLPSANEGSNDMDTNARDTITPRLLIDPSPTESLSSANEGSNDMDTNARVTITPGLLIDPSPTESLSSVKGRSNDIFTNTSQPLFRDCSTGNSQPNLMDCAVGNSQPDVMNSATGMSEPLIITVECGIQTSQELLPCPQSLPRNMLPAEKTEEHHGKLDTKYGTKAPIVSHRVCCQTAAPTIPAKIPRLNDLDRNTLNPIYSSAVTFGFDDESDKENDKTVLRQRGNVRKILGDASFPTPNTECDIADKENMSGDTVNPSSNMFFSTRGPVLRVGLSKRSRTNPLHHRSFGNENRN